MKLKIGDVVRLITGGQPMTVVGVETETVSPGAEVAWFEGTSLHRDQFPIASLAVVDPKQDSTPPKPSPLGTNPSPTYTAR